MVAQKTDIKTNHRFLDEAGDTTFFGKGKKLIVGQEGVSKSFILGLVKIREPLNVIKSRVIELQQKVATDPYYREIPSIQKKIASHGFYFHANEDIPEVRELFYKFIFSVDCSFEAVVGRKMPQIFDRKHHNNEAEFYADLLSHLLKNKLSTEGKLILNIAERGKSTKNANLQTALDKATKRFKERKPGKEACTTVAFNIQTPLTEPLLSIADYFCWAVQRVFERGEMRYYDYLIDKMSLIIDLYDREKWEGSRNYYIKTNPLSVHNKISP